MSESIRLIEKLSHEEKILVCDSIAPYLARSLLEENKQVLKRSVLVGQRISNITGPQAVNLLKLHIDNIVVSHILNTVLETWVTNVKQDINQSIADGLSAQESLFKALTNDSYMAFQPRLFFVVAKDYLGKLEIKTDKRSVTKFNTEITKRLKASLSKAEIIELENKDLKKQVKTLKSDKKLLIAANEQLTQDLSLEKEQVASLSEAHKKSKTKLSALTAENKKLKEETSTFHDQFAQNNKHLEYLQRQVNDLTNISSLLKISDDDYLASLDDTMDRAAFSGQSLSICCVSGDHQQNYLTRLADLTESGTFYPFHANLSAQSITAKAVRLNLSDASKKRGSVGVWSWVSGTQSTTLNYQSVFNAYTKYEPSLEPIEIAILNDVSTLEQLIERVKNGIKYTAISNKVLFSARQKDATFIGVLYTPSNSNIPNITDNTYILKSTCNELAIYKFNGGSILMNLCNGHSFYNRPFLGKPAQVCALKTTFDVVKNIVVSSLSFALDADKSLEYQSFDNIAQMLTNMPAMEDIPLQIMTACHCSYEQAQVYLNKFLQEAHKYINHNTFKDHVLIEVAKQSPELQNRIKALLKQEWEQEFSHEINSANTKIAELRTQIDTLDHELSAKNNELDSSTANVSNAQEALSAIKSSIALEEARLAQLQKQNQATLQELKSEQQEELRKLHAQKEQEALAIEKAIEDRIEKAKNSVADSIADFAFFKAYHAVAQNLEKRTPLTTTSQEQDAASAYPPSQVQVCDTSIKQSCYKIVERDYDDLGEAKTIGQVYKALTQNLKKAGVAHRYSHDLAKYLLSAYIEKQPILLAGPNSMDIVQALSAVVAENVYGVLSCSEGLNEHDFEKIGHGKDRVVVLQNLLSSPCINQLETLLSRPGVFFVATHPYKEDLQVEPKGLYSFILPLITEYFISSKPSGAYTVYLDEDKLLTNTHVEDESKIEMLSSFAPSKLVANRIESLFSRMSNIGLSQDDTDDAQLILALLPLAFVMMRLDRLKAMFEGNSSSLSLSEQLRDELELILGDIA